MAPGSRTSARDGRDREPGVRRRGKSPRFSTHSVRILGLRAELRVSGTVEERIEAVANRQRGRISRTQLAALGISRAVRQRLIDHRQLLPVAARVYAVGHRAQAPLSLETTALLAAGHPRALLSHDSAARLWDMPAPDAGVHVLVPDGTRTRASGYILHRTRCLDRADVRVRHGLPLTSPARTLLDLAPRLTVRQLELAIDRAVVHHGMRLADLRDVLKRLPTRPGAPLLQHTLDARTSSTLTRSAAEERFLALLREARLPPPRVNARVAGYEVDFVWLDQGLVVEIDGYAFHSTRRAIEHDRRKERDLRAAGFVIIRFSYAQLTREALATVADVARALASG